MKSKSISFPSGALTLEGVLTIDRGATSLPGVVVCHPHPLYGGDMDDQVVRAICHELESIDIASLRFNFRGVENSQGEFDAGVGEADDLRAAISTLQHTPGVDPDSIGVAGYSFGATVALDVAAADPRVKALATVSLPLKGRVPKPNAGYRGPSLLVSGDRDPFVPTERLKSLAQRLAGPAECRIVAGANHFWGPHMEELTSSVADFFSRYLV